MIEDIIAFARTYSDLPHGDVRNLFSSDVLTPVDLAIEDLGGPLMAERMAECRSWGHPRLLAQVADRTGCRSIGCC